MDNLINGMALVTMLLYYPQVTVSIAFADYKNIYIFEDEISFCQIDLEK